MPNDQWLDILAAAERHSCGTKIVWWRVCKGSLPSRTEKM